MGKHLFAEGTIPAAFTLQESKTSPSGGLSWQIVPAIFSELLHDEDGEKSQRAMNAMLQMKKSI